MKIDNSLELIAKHLEIMSLSKEERDKLFIFISRNLDQFFEINERMVSEVKNIKDSHPNNWKEMVAMTMFSTL